MGYVQIVYSGGSPPYTPMLVTSQDWTLNEDSIEIKIIMGTKYQGGSPSYVHGTHTYHLKIEA